jgi:hypothetical protein
MIERWLLNKLSKDQPPAAETSAEKKTTAASGPSGEGSNAEPNPTTTSRLGELWNRMQQAADKDTSITRTNGTPNPNRNGKKKKKR